jgi:hypothetical protein
LILYIPLVNNKEFIKNTSLGRYFSAKTYPTK